MTIQPFRTLRSNVVKRKIVSAFLTFLLLFQNVLPIVQVGIAVAQETSTSVVEEVQPTPAPEATPASEPTPESTPESTPDSNPESSPAPEVTPIPEPSVEPAMEPSPSVEPTVIPSPEPTTETQATASNSAEVDETQPESQTSQEQANDLDGDETQTYSPTDILAIPLNIPTFEEGIVQGSSTLLSEGPVEKVCSSEESSVTQTQLSDWDVNAAEGSATSKGPVQLGVQYVFPLENKVTVTFKCLPKNESDRSQLKIQQLSTNSIDFPNGLYAASDYAFDITTEGMENGNFEYDVTLPNNEGEGAQITYLEKSIQEVTSQSLSADQFKSVPESNVRVEGDKIVGANLDHFTILVATTESDFSTDQSTYVQGENVYISATGLDTSKFYRIDITDPSAGTTNVDGCDKPSTSTLNITYALSASAPVGSNWIVTIGKYDKNNECNDKSAIEDSGTDTFSVTEFANITSSAVQTTTNACMDDLTPGNLTCTANDVTIANVTGITILDDGCQSPQDTVTFQANWQVLSGANQRYDVGLWFATGGQVSALAGSCSTSILPNSPTPPWFNYDGDACGDINSSTTLNPVITLTVACSDPDGDNTLNLPYCTSWQQNTVGVCSAPTDTIPGAPSKCNCENGFEVGVTVPHTAKIEVVKDLIPSADPGTFNLNIDGTTKKSCAIDNETTGSQTVSAGTSASPGASHVVAESSCSGTDMADYASSISCVKRGTSTVVAAVSGALSVNVPVLKDDDIVCTITNTRINNGSITIVKDSDPNSAQDFAFTSTELSNFSLEDDGDATPPNSKTFSNLPAGSYAVAETPTNETYLESIICTGDTDNGSVVSLENGQVTIDVDANEAITCTFTNKPQGTIAVEKNVVPDDSDATQWDFAIVGETDNDVTLTDGKTSASYFSLPGSYTITETPKSPALAADYTTTWSCVQGTEPLANGSGTVAAFTLVLGKNVQCTFTNTAIAPELTLVKMVTNDNGGTALASAWTLSATGSGGFSGVGVQDANSNMAINGPHEVNADVTYALSESGPTGYSASNWSCVKNTEAPVLGNTISLELGDVATCTITNNDIQPTLTLNKILPNDNGGNETIDDFQAYIGDIPVAWGQAIPVNAGQHTVSEDTLTGYIPSNWGGNCAADGSVALLPGENKTCTITNDDEAPTLKLIKVVNENFGGTAQPNDFKLTIGGLAATSGTSYPQMANTAIALDETMLDGYEFVSITGTNCPSTLGGTVTLDEGEDVTCTITNTDQAGHLIVNKITNPASDTTTQFSITVAGGTVNEAATQSITGGTSVDFSVDAGVFSVSEAPIVGWDETANNCVNVAVAIGETKECTITNTQLSSLTVTKDANWSGVVMNSSEEFEICIQGPSYPTTANCQKAPYNGGDLTWNNLIAGDYTVTETDPGSEWNVQLPGNVISVPTAGGSAVATVTNTRKLGGLNVTKVVDWNGVAENVNQLFQICIVGPSYPSGNCQNADFDGALLTWSNLIPGNYAVSETDPGSDWQVVVPAGEIAVPVDGGTASARVTNTHTQDPQLMVEKSSTTTAITAAGQVIPYVFVVTNEGNIALTGITVTDANCDSAPAYQSGDLNLDNKLQTDEEWTYTCSHTVTQGEIDAGGNLTNTVTADSTESAPDDDTNNIPVTVGKIIIIKQTLPDGATESFTFDPSWSRTDFTLTDGQSKDSGWLAPATYSVSETLPDGWFEESVLCESSAEDKETAESISLQANETVTCTFTNAKKPILTVIKTVINDNYLGSTYTASDFDLEISGTATSSTKTFPGNSLGTTFMLNPGDYVATESAQPLYDTTFSDDCTGTLAYGDDKTCTITNNDKPTRLILRKIVENNFGGTATASAWTVSATGGPTPISGQGEALSDNSTFQPGTYLLSESGPAGYSASDWSCVGGGSLSSGQDGNTYLTLTQGNDPICTITNSDTFGRVTVTKYHDRNGDGNQDEGEESLSGWDIQLDETTETTGETGRATFAQVLPGEYTLSETIQPGWSQTNISCRQMQNEDRQLSYEEENPLHNSNNYPLAVGNREQIECSIGNIEDQGVLQITKTNNSYPTTQHPGDVITYTLTITAKDGSVGNVQMIDVPQDGFDYVNNSWTASSSVRGNIKNAPTTQPTYGSPGKWLFGDMVEDEVLTLTYQAKIGSDVTAGTYPDLAYAYGTQRSGATILAEAQPTGYISPEYVGTDVIVAVNNPGGTLGYEVERKETVTGQVLGASTELPATGMPLTLPLIGFGMFIAGLLTLLAGLFIHRRHALARAASGMGVALLILIGLVTPASAYESLSLRVEQLPSPYNQKEFKLRYVVLDIDNRTISIECFKKAPSAGGFTQFGGTTAIQAGGDNNYCNVTSDITGEAGTYQFYVRATPNGGIAIDSPIQAVDLRTNTGPGTPTNYSRDRQSCKDRLSFTAADDGDKTARIEVYRSENKSFTADSGTRIDNFGASSKENFTKEYDRPDCGKSYYFVVRAFDSANNGSGLVGDTETIVTTVNTTTTTTTQTTGALPVYYGAGTSTSTRTGGSVLGTADLFEDVADLNGDGVIDESELAAASESAKAAAAAQLKAEQEKEQTATQGSVLGSAIVNFFSSLPAYVWWILGAILIVLLIAGAARFL